MSEYSDFELREVKSSYLSSYKAVERLLNKCNLNFEKLEYMSALFDSDNNAVCCGGYDGSTIKCVAVDEAYRGEGLSNKLITHLLQRLNEKGVNNITVFTKNANEDMFTSFGFKLIERAERAILLERGSDNLEKHLEKLEKSKTDGVSGGIVMNCNPFTLGHRYLIEQASKQCDTLHIFVVEEDKSIFPFETRMELVKRGVADINNVVVHSGGRYVISNSTFPSYFLKEYSAVTKNHAELDIRIFGHYIAKALNITKRFAGSEPIDKVTAEYNEAMKAFLPIYDVTPIIIDRKTADDGNLISASSVRKLFYDGDFEKLKQFVPQSTLDFLMSPEGDFIKKRMESRI